VLCAAFLLYQIGFEFFLVQKFVEKGSRKMLMKLITVFEIVIFFSVAGFLLSRLLLLGHVLCHHRGDVEQGRPRRYSQRLLVLQDPYHGRARCNHLRHPNLTSGSGTTMSQLYITTFHNIFNELFLNSWDDYFKNQKFTMQFRKGICKR